MIRSMEGFSFDSALDLNMCYYHIKLDHDADAQKICTIIIPWNVGKYKYKRLPMGIKIAPEHHENAFTELALLGQKTWNDDEIKKRWFVQNAQNIGLVDTVLNN
jgi:hypothetical protein